MRRKKWFGITLVVAVFVVVTSTIGGTWALAQSGDTSGVLTWDQYAALTPEEQANIWDSLTVTEQTSLWGQALRSTITDEVEFALQQGIDIRTADLELLYTEAGTVSSEVQKLRNENAALLAERNALNWEVQQLRMEIGSLQVSANAVFDAATTIQDVKTALEGLQAVLASNVDSSTQVTGELNTAKDAIVVGASSYEASATDSLDAAITMRQAIIELEQVIANASPASSGGTDEEFWLRACNDVVDALWDVEGMTFSGAVNAWNHFGC